MWKVVKENIVLGLLTLFVVSWVMGAFDPKPYTNVEVISYELPSHKRILTFDFYIPNDNCTYGGIDVFNIYFGERTEATWRFLGEPRGDRPVGPQTFYMEVSEEDNVHSIQVWTRHICKGEVVERLMHEEVIE